MIKSYSLFSMTLILLVPLFLTFSLLPSLNKGNVSLRFSFDHFIAYIQNPFETFFIFKISNKLATTTIDMPYYF